ncbi:MAG: hypothetical protein AVDCRST_MAG30-3253, partial [uncultured Solirubrobacteraceae bacterium]
ARRRRGARPPARGGRRPRPRAHLGRDRPGGRPRPGRRNPTRGATGSV